MAFNTQFWTWMFGWNQSFGGTGSAASVKTQDDDTYNPRYPWFNKENYERLEKKVSELWLTWNEKLEVMDQFYRQILPQVEEENKRAKRNEVLNQKKYDISQIQDDVQRKVANHSYTVEELAQKVKEKENLREDAPDAEVFNTWISTIPNGEELLGNYMNKWDKELLYAWWLETRPKEKSFWDKAGEFWVWVAQSPGKRGYNLIGQWMDKLWKAAADKLEGTKLAEWVKKEAIDVFWEDEVKAFAEQRQQELADWIAFKGREATDIRTPILWEERANSKNVKAWEVVGDIATAIALTYPLWATVAPILKASSTLWAWLLWGGAWTLDAAVTHYGREWDFNVKPGELLLGAITGSLWGVATNKLSNLPKNTVKNIENTADKLDDAANASKVANTTREIADKTDDANRIAGRIWQWDIDDQAKVVKGVKSLTDRMWKDSVKSIKTYDQLDDAIRSTERQIIEQEDDLLRQFPDKITDWTTKETVKWLWDQVDDVTRDYLDDGIELLKKYNKNDPAAMKELEMLQNAKNTEWLTRLEAKNLARRLTSKLSRKFYNSNDELRNSMSAESYEKIRKGIQDAVRDRLPDGTLKDLDLEYSNLKSLEWLTDDMAEKVNTLTQKLKATWPLERFGRKVWDAINRVTGKSVKWLVEKFLPSNMWNKINNSIDIETELAENLGKLVKLNDAIDGLNTTINNSATKSVVASALRKFANIVSEIKPIEINTAVRWAEATVNELYND